MQIKTGRTTVAAKWVYKAGGINYHDDVVFSRQLFIKRYPAYDDRLIKKGSSMP